MLLHERNRQMRTRTTHINQKLKEIEHSKATKELKAKREAVRKEIERRIHLEIYHHHQESYRQNLAARKIQTFVRGKYPKPDNYMSLRQSLQESIDETTRFSQFMYLNFGENLRNSVIKIQRFFRKKREDIKLKKKYEKIELCIMSFAMKLRIENRVRDLKLESIRKRLAVLCIKKYWNRFDCSSFIMSSRFRTLRLRVKNKASNLKNMRKYTVDENYPIFAELNSTKIEFYRKQKTINQTLNQKTLGESNH